MDIVILVIAIFVYFFIGHTLSEFIYKFTGDAGGFGCLMCVFNLFSWPISIPMLVLMAAGSRIAEWAYKKFGGE